MLIICDNNDALRSGSLYIETRTLTYVGMHNYNRMAVTIIGGNGINNNHINNLAPGTVEWNGNGTRVYSAMQLNYAIICLGQLGILDDRQFLHFELTVN